MRRGARGELYLRDCTSTTKIKMDRTAKSTPVMYHPVPGPSSRGVAGPLMVEIEVEAGVSFMGALVSAGIACRSGTSLVAVQRNRRHWREAAHPARTAFCLPQRPDNRNEENRQAKNGQGERQTDDKERRAGAAGKAGRAGVHALPTRPHAGNVVRRSAVPCERSAGQWCR